MDEGVIEGVDPVIFGHAVVGMCLQLIHGYLVEKKMDRELIIRSLITMILAMFEVHLTERAKNLYR